MASDPALVFLDANVLARPVTRTLLLVGADPSGLAVTWSAHVEAEADRHVRGSALPVSGLRKWLDRVFGWRPVTEVGLATASSPSTCPRSRNWLTGTRARSNLPT